MTITSVQAKVRKTATFDGTGIDISAMTGDWTLVLEVMKVEGTNPLARFVFEDSVDAFSANIAGASVSIAGDLGDLNYTPDANVNVRRFTFSKRDFPSLRFGTASAVIRLSLVQIGGTNTPAVTYQSWIET